MPCDAFTQVLAVVGLVVAGLVAVYFVVFALVLAWARLTGTD